MRRFPVSRLANRLISSAVPNAQAQGPSKIPPSIWQKTTSKLHLKQHHPLNTLRAAIEQHFNKTHPSLFTTYNDLSPIVTIEQCFNDLNVPPNHPSRAPSDTYYIDNDTLLRTHMTAHDVSLLRAGNQAFILCGDVYRRDTVDRTHYPVFHQIDAVRLFQPNTPRDEIVTDLQQTLTALAGHLFGLDIESRWVDATFPFTTPSFELEVYWQGEWLELLGCGLLHRNVLRSSGIPQDVNGWAFGLGLERLAMVLFGVPDIRLFWSEDERFLSQFEGGRLDARFKQFSVYPSVKKDVSFWLDDEEAFHENDIHEFVRSIAGDLVESVSLVDMFERDGRKSLCFRIVFQSMERSLTHEEVNSLYYDIREIIGRKLSVTVR